MVFANVTPVRAGGRSLNSGRLAVSGRHPATASRATTRAQRMRAASMAGGRYPLQPGSREGGLTAPAATGGSRAGVYQEASGKGFQVYLKSSGRVVHLWADAANESVGFGVRDSTGKPAELAWGSSGAVVERSTAGRTRSVSYGLEAPSTVKIGLLLLGSMRVERDFGYGERDSLPLDAPPFVQNELTQLIDHIAKLKGPERARHLALLGVKSVEALRARLAPRIVLNPSPPLSAPRGGGQGVRTDSAMRGVGRRAVTEKTDATWVVEGEQA